MALEGRLNDFTLEEILQLIALQQKTGVLTVEASYPMVLYFESGELVGYRDRRGAAPDPLQAYLKSYGFFTAENWEHLRFIQSNSGLDFTEIIINEGHMTPEELLRVQHDVAQEHIFKGMLLRDGRYHFQSGRELLHGIRARVRVKVEGLLMEAARRIDEIATLEERYFDVDVRVRRTEKSTEGLPLGHRPLNVLQLVGEEATVGYVEARAKISHFDVLQNLEMLRDLGLIRVLDLPQAEVNEDELVVPEEVTRRTSLPAVIVVLLSLGVLALSWWLTPMRSYAERVTPAVTREQNYKREELKSRVRHALALYHASKSVYPATLNALTTPLTLELNSDELAQFSYRRNGLQDYELDFKDQR
jgi:hypothetical protein